jgi:hypothetical protein
MPPKPQAPSPQTPTRQAKTFKVGVWDGAGEGQKVIVYGASGKGKTSLAAIAPRPIFIGLDDGGRMVRNAITGEAISRVPGVESFPDVRDALHQAGLFDGYKSIVIDTGTILELLAIQWVIENVPHEKAGTRISHIDDYGYGKGYNHLFDTMRLVLQDLDSHVRQGRNVIVLCQQMPVVVANAAGANYLQDGPKLYAPGPDSKQSFTIRGYACEWADHVFKIDYLQQIVSGARTEERSGKIKEFAGKVTGDTTRAIFTAPTDPSFFAKTRTLKDPVVSFNDQTDDSIWRLLFPEEYPA